MGNRGRPKQPLTLTDEERETLRRWSRRPKSPHSLAQRSRIVLVCANGADNVTVAEKLGVNQATVGKWRRRFLERRLDGLVDEPRPGAPRTITDDDVEAVIVRTLEDKPTDATHWSTRDLAGEGRDVAVVGRSDLAGVRAQAVAGRHVQAVRGSACSSRRSATSSGCT